MYQKAGAGGSLQLYKRRKYSYEDCKGIIIFHSTENGFLTSEVRFGPYDYQACIDGHRWTWQSAPTIYG